MHILLLKEKENNFKDQKLLNVNFKMFKKVFVFSNPFVKSINKLTIFPLLQL